MGHTEVDLKKAIWRYVIFFGPALIVIALDQWTKMLVRVNIPYGEIWSPWDWLTPIARIIYWTNTGAAFGMLQKFGGVFTLLAMIVAVVIIFYFPRIPESDWPLRLALGLQLGGAVGNLIDRLTHGNVTDFISVGTFPVFNIADASITCGVIILLIGVWWTDRQERARAKSGTIASQPKPKDSPNAESEHGG